MLLQEKEITELERITDENDSRVRIFRLPEVQLLRYYEPEPGLFVCETPRVIERAIAAGYEPTAFLTEEDLLEKTAAPILAAYPDLPSYVVSHELMRRIANCAMLRGMLCVMRRKRLPGLREFLAALDCGSSGAGKSLAVMENVINPTNIGAIFRAAAAMNVGGVLLTSGCSDPLYRRASRVSMGTVFGVPWTMPDRRFKWPAEGIRLLKESGYTTLALALKEDAVSILDIKRTENFKPAMILGTEGDGLMKETIEACDQCVIIPMREGVDSLNVSAAAAVAFWEMTGRYGAE